MTRSLAASALVLTSVLALAACGAGASEGGGVHTPGGAKHELVDNPAPSFSAESVNGMGAVSLADLEGKVVLVDFWATWCEPCQKSFPKFEELRVKYEASGLAVVGVSEDDEDKGEAAIKAFGEKHGAKFPLVWDKDNAIAKKWSPPNMPTSFIVDKKGVVRFVHLGYHDGDEREIERQVKSLL
jgi:cytochrome c biogenesis protein CcmG, thiol:disulfide interchange protein DsbE